MSNSWPSSDSTTYLDFRSRPYYGYGKYDDDDDYRENYSFYLPPEPKKPEPVRNQVEITDGD